MSPPHGCNKMSATRRAFPSFHEQRYNTPTLYSLSFSWPPTMSTLPTQSRRGLKEYHHIPLFSGWFSCPHFLCLCPRSVELLRTLFLPFQFGSSLFFDHGTIHTVGRDRFLSFARSSPKRWGGSISLSGCLFSCALNISRCL